MDESGTDEAKCYKKVSSGRRATGAVRSMVNVQDLQIEQTRVLDESLLVLVLLYDIKTMIWEEEMPRIRAVQIFTKYQENG